MTPAEQANAFAAMLLCGACMGVVYDMLGMLRRVRGLCAIADILFGCCCAAGVILTALRLQIDAFRLYVFAGVGCGMALYGVTIGAAIRKLAAAIRRKIPESEEKCKKNASTEGI